MPFNMMAPYMNTMSYQPMSAHMPFSGNNMHYSTTNNLESSNLESSNYIDSNTENNITA